MKAFLKQLINDQRGTSAVEMGLICALIILAMLSALKGFASENNNTWNAVASKSQAAIAAS